jgi:hypothetical protein
MSDTVVVTVVVKGPDAPRRGLYRAMLSASMIAGEIVFDAVHGSPALLFRGCLAAGEMTEEADFLIGPAVDEAAECFERAQGPFFWLAPSALEISKRYAETFPDRLEPTVMLPYAVPLNNGSSTTTHAFTYFGLTTEANARAETRRRVLEAFGDDPLAADVGIKRRNAASFLDYVEAVASAGDWKKGRFILRRPDWEDLSPSQRMKLLLVHCHDIADSSAEAE